MFVCCDNYLLKAAKTEVRSNLINEHPQSMLSTFGYCVVSNAVCYLGQSGSAGVSDFILCHTVKDFCKASSIPPSCDAFSLVHQTQSRSPLLGREAYKHRDTQTWGQIHKSSGHRLGHAAGRQEDRAHMQKDIENPNLGSFLVRGHQGEGSH